MAREKAAREKAAARKQAAREKAAPEKDARKTTARRKTTGTGATRLGEPTLTAADWAEAALQLIAEKGLGALTVDALAARLGVTKGSFYWHFRGRMELIAAALARWEEGSTMMAMRSLESVPDPRRRLQLLLEASSQPPRSRSLYAALAEAAEEPVVRRVLNRVASARIAYLESCYAGLALAPDAAKAHAVLAYAAYRGLLQLAHEAPAALPQDWTVFPAIMQQALVPPAAPPKPARPAPARKKAR